MSQGNSLKDNFIILLAHPDNQDARNYLFEQLSSFSLLKYRTGAIAELLSSKKKANEKLSDHCELVKWQLHRIYRSRNRIVHSGEREPHNKYLVENAHDFFDQTLLFCLELSAWKRGFSTFLQCFDYADRQYNRYTTGLCNDDAEINVVWQLPKYRGRSVVFGEQRE